MSRDTVLQALREQRAVAERLAASAWTGIKAGAGGAYHAGAGLLGAPQGDSGYGDPSIGSRIAADLQRDFGLTASQAAGVVGNLGHESGGFKYYQEIDPTAGRGGAGWAQWTGPRRTSFENYARANNLNPQSYAANYGFLKNELTGTHKNALSVLRRANTVQDSVYAFEGAFEKAGVKNYGSRMRYANNLGAGSGSITARGSQVEALQRDLNSRGASLKVDGLLGPQTRAAQQQFLGSPTSVRTPSFAAPRAVSAGVSTPRTPYYSNPYTSSTGGASALTVQPRPVPTSAIKASPYGGPQLPSYSSNITYPNAIQTGARAVPTTAVPASSRPPVGGNVWGAFNRPSIQTPGFMNPYTMGTGGAHAIVAPVQTARMPQPRPAYPPPSVSVASGPTLMQQMQDQMRRAAAVAAQVGGQFKDAYSQGTRSGMGYQGGGGYTGGSYGGAAGRSIASGVGGAFRNR